MTPTSSIAANQTIPIGFFALAVGSYVVHGLLRDTDNQLRSPHRLGPLTLPGLLMRAVMISLIVGEVGGVGILVHGVITSP